MASHLVTPTGDRTIAAIFDFIWADNPAAAETYQQRALDSFFTLSANYLPRRASEHLPEYVRELPIAGYRGYTLRIAQLDGTLYLLSAHRPGREPAAKDRQTRRGIGDIPESAEEN